MDAMLSRFRSEHALNNLEELDGFFAALICSPETAKPSEYLPEIWAGEMADDEAFDDRQELQDFPESTDATLEQHCPNTRIRGNFRSFVISRTKKVPLMATTGHADSCVALTCIMKAGKNCSRMKNMEVH